MFSSEEVRWFFPGEIPAEVLTWFSQGECQPVQQNSRVDWYLRLPEVSLGVKLREGRLELKQRYGQSGTVRILNRIVGIVESWSKWGFALAESDDESTKVGPPIWIAVSKERWLCKYRLAKTGKVSVVSIEDYLERGGHLELTQIALKNTRWWTLGFEVFGAGAASREDLIRIMEHVFRVVPAPMALHAEGSYGYPKWLQEVSFR